MTCLWCAMTIPNGAQLHDAVSSQNCCMPLHNNLTLYRHMSRESWPHPRSQGLAIENDDVSQDCEVMFQFWGHCSQDPVHSWLNSLVCLWSVFSLNLGVPHYLKFDPHCICTIIPTCLCTVTCLGLDWYAFKVFSNLDLKNLAVKFKSENIFGRRN